MFKKLLLIGSLGILASAAKAQTSTGIGTIIPDANAILDVNSNAKGVLIPRMTISDRTTNIPFPTEGLMVYQSDGITGLYIYNNGAWKRMVTSTEIQRFSAGGTNSVSLTATAMGPYLLPGLTQSVTVTTPSTVTLTGTVGASNGVNTANAYSVVDIIAFVDGTGVAGTATTGAVYSRFYVTNPSVTANALATTTIATSFPLAVGTHVIALGAYRAGGTATSVTVGANQVTSAIPASMVLQVIPN